VYSTLIDSKFLHNGIARVVIDDSTSPGYGNSGDLELIKSQAKQLQGLTTETVESFVDRNNQPFELEDRFDLDVEVVLISAQQIQEIFQDGSGWDQFYDLYPNSQGELQLSQVGFNSHYDQALVYAGNQSYWLAGSGSLFLLEKVDGLWQVQDEIMVWIS
jgi:hypothetical protein